MIGQIDHILGFIPPGIQPKLDNIVEPALVAVQTTLFYAPISHINVVILCTSVACVGAGITLKI